MSTPAEEWRVIAEFPEFAVSDLGRVKRIVPARSSRAGRILRQNECNGYNYVSLTASPGIYANKRVNRLVCAAFHGEPPTPHHQAAHCDGDRSNDRADNLRWATPVENNLDKHAHGTMPTGNRNGARLHPERLARGARNGRHTKPGQGPQGERHGCAKLSESDVRAIRKDGRSRRQIASAYGVSKCAIDGIKQGRTWRHVA